jgi:hypothetical protein
MTKEKILIILANIVHQLDNTALFDNFNRGHLWDLRETLREICAKSDYKHGEKMEGTSNE